jgi:hypothetical protein
MYTNLYHNMTTKVLQGTCPDGFSWFYFIRR